MSLFWEQLLDLVEERRVVPVVGPELLELGDEGRGESLYPLIARRLGEYLEVPSDDLPAGDELNAVACRFIDQRQDVQDLYPALKKVMPGADELATPEPLLQLARIRHLNLFVTTTFDPLLVRALDEVRFGGQAKTQVLAYSPSEAEDIPDKAADLESPVVYHLFGKLSAMPTYAVTQEDVLEFIYSLQAADFKQPQLLFEELQNNNLLILGSNLGDWLVRLFLRIAKHQRLVEVRRSTEFLVGSGTQNEELVSFLRYYSSRTKIYQNGGGVEFAARLYEQWAERHPDETASTAVDEPAAEAAALTEPGAVFLSYASEDREAAQQLKQALEEVGIDVFFDREQLRAGDDWEAKLLRTISECSLFLPVISSSSLATARRYFRAEWERALDEARKVAASERYLLPVVIDDTRQDEPALPQKFRDHQWTPAPGGRPPAEFVDEVRRLFRRYHKEALGR